MKLTILNDESPGFDLSNHPGVPSVVLYVVMVAGLYHNVKCYLMYYFN